jgi:replication initiation protein RepC
MLTFLPLKDRQGNEVPAQSDMLLVCYASNASICHRAGGIDESTLRRHIRRLVARGLIARRDSATGKRFPLKRSGKVCDAFGIDLSPAFHSAGQLETVVEEAARRDDERRALRSQTLALRAKVLNTLCDLTDAARDFLSELTNLLRRKSTTLMQIQEAHDTLMEMLSEVDGQKPAARPTSAALPAVQAHASSSPALRCNSNHNTLSTEETPANDVQNTRQVEPKNSNKKNITPSSVKAQSPTLTYADLLNANPSAAEFMPREVKSLRCIVEAVSILGLSLGLKNIPYERVIEVLNLSSLLSLLDRMVRNIESIAQPQKYFEAAVADQCSQLQTTTFLIRYT